MSKTKIKYKDPENAYIKAIKRVMREEVGFTPTKIKASKKTYNRAKNRFSKNDINNED
jgi:hypothetical protein